jgi:hypothetical protein
MGGKGSPQPKKAQMSRSKIKVLVVFFDWKGIPIPSNE